MILVDKEINVFLANGQIGNTDNQTAIFDGSHDCVTNIGYDLRTRGFIKNGEILTHYDLEPGESAFVESVETVHFDNSTCGIVNIKNSRLRLGLSVEAPVYQPGHKTKIYFRITNLSDRTILLSAGEKYAYIMFEQLISVPDKTYEGTFQNEFKYTGLANYEPVYAEQQRAAEKKLIDLKELEKNIYGNVITIVTVFIAVFSLLNINVTLAQNGTTAANFLMYNSSILGAISFLAILLDELLHRKEKRGHWLWIIPIVCFAAVILCIFI